MQSRLSHTILWVALLAFFFAHIEIQIEGAHGWAGALPTWRIEEHWLLDIFWGGRAMTGYHAWVFPFIAIFFHFPVVFADRWTVRLECRMLACIILFWVIEDFLWFMLNPAYGIGRFTPEAVPWHKHWFMGTPVDYWFALPAAAGLFYISSLPDWRNKEKA
jgi:hypothetical protein